MLKIDQLISFGESLSINKRKDRSAFYESVMLQTLNKDLSLRWDRYNLTKYIAGEDGTSFKDKAKKLASDTWKLIKAVIRNIWESIKRTGRWFKYLLTGKIKDFKDDENWRSWKDEILSGLDDCINTFEKRADEYNGLHIFESNAKELVEKLKEVREVLLSEKTSSKEKLEASEKGVNYIKEAADKLDAELQKYYKDKNISDQSFERIKDEVLAMMKNITDTEKASAKLAKEVNKENKKKEKKDNQSDLEKAFGSNFKKKKG